MFCILMFENTLCVPDTQSLIFDFINLTDKTPDFGVKYIHNGKSKWNYCILFCFFNLNSTTLL